METLAYKDPDLAVEKRIADLLGRMTLEEKAAQLNQPFFGWQAYTKDGDTIGLSDEFKAIVTGAGIGALYGLHRADPWSGRTLSTGLSPKQGAVAANMIQKFVIENTRLGIPLLISEECPHGHMAIGATVLPVPILMGGTWNPSLIKSAAAVAAAETRAEGANVGYGPVLDIAHDPRWSRVEETFGEDAYLAGQMGVAAVEGMQGTDLAGDRAIISTLKHFAAYGDTEGGRNAAPAHVGERELREVLLPAFEAAVKAGALSLMAAFNEIDGVPCSCNKRLLTEILRTEWGFEGFVVADGTGVDWLTTMHRVAEDFEQAGVMAVEAGLDLSLWDKAFGCLVEAVKKNKLSMDLLDQAVARVLRAKFLLGLFENPYVDIERAEIVVGCDEHRQIARQMAREGIILLKNEDDLLPLSKDIGSIAVIGPNADNIYNQLGDYTAPQRPEDIVTVLDGIKAKVSARTTVRYAPGSRITDDSKSGFAEAIECARVSDVAVVVVGGSSARDFSIEHAQTGAAVVGDGSSVSDMECGEGFDRSNLDLAGVQVDLLKKIYATGTPMIVILIQGRPYSINWIAEHAPAVVNAWYPGQEGGTAIADILFGDYNPAGRLSVSIPKSAGQLPVYYNRKPSAAGGYVFCDSKPIYSFGYGLSYTTFAYSNLTVSPQRISPGQPATVNVDVTNTGDRAGDEVVQMYIRDEVSSVTRPIKELKGFLRIHLRPSETKTVTLEILPEHLSLLDTAMRRLIEPGEFTIMVGGNQDDVRTVRLTVSDR